MYLLFWFGCNVVVSKENLLLKLNSLRVNTCDQYAVDKTLAVNLDNWNIFETVEILPVLCLIIQILCSISYFHRSYIHKSQSNLHQITNIKS